MQILDNILILLLPVLTFVAGKRISDAYHRAQIEELEYQLRLYAAEKGVGYISYPQKRIIGQPFMDRLKKTGRAIQQFPPARTEKR